MRQRWWPIALVAALALAACAEAETSEVILTSSAFGDGDPIPGEHTCDGADTSPPLAWTDVPDGVAAFAVLVTDPDAGGFVHWVLADIPADVRELPAGEGDALGVPGGNGFGDSGWGGPCPPSGEHRYEFRLYALSELIGLESPTADDVRAAGAEAVATGELLGVYARR
jgi:Raf kinase inhibitor-like YbhB/YbcL family protein